MERLARAFIGNDHKSFERAVCDLDSLLSEHNLDALSVRFSEIVHLWASENTEMDSKDVFIKPTAIASSSKCKVVIKSAFASKTTAPNNLGLDTRRKFRKSFKPQLKDDDNNNGGNDAFEGKGKGKMPAIAAPPPSDASSASEAESLVLSRSSFDALHDYRTRAMNESDLNASLCHRVNTHNKQYDEQPDESNDWGVEKGDGVLIGRPPEYPAGLLDWGNEDKGKTVADHAPDNLTRVTTGVNALAASTFRAAQGALNGLISSSGDPCSSRSNEKAQQRKTEKGNKKRKQMKGKYVKDGKEQEGAEYAHHYSDFYDSSEGSDWVNL